jgi:hypothetical protein
MLKRKGMRILIYILTPIFVLFGGFLIYTIDDYDLVPYCDDTYQDILINENRHEITYGESDASIGIIFYQGGKVDEKAYELFLLKLASNDLFIVNVKMPFNLAVFGSNRALDVIEKYQDIDTWYLMGHSLGGAMASSFAAQNPNLIEGLILLSAYASSDLSNTELSMLSIYGSNDGVLSMDEVENTKSNNPENTTYYVIEGGNHSGFANYGEQKGDLDRDITQFAQQNLTVFAIIDFLTSSR